ncbi:MAG: Kae1-associated kinase Bud32 [Candidatus Njordarchaeota archaeon]
MINDDESNNDWILISKGAEATLYRGTFLGFPAIKKIRHPKHYRIPQLDIVLRRTRTRREARLLAISKKIGVNTPFVFDIDLLNCTIIMEYIDGILMRDLVSILEKNNLIDRAKYLMKKAGQILGLLHINRILHGDFTTSNIIVSNQEDLFVIDFGLGMISMTNDPEDYAVELRVFSRSLEIFHTSNYDKYLNSFLEGYRDSNGSETVIRRFFDISMRGRYVSERRTKKTFIPHNKDNSKN